MIITLYIILAWNIVVFSIYGIDKLKAVKNKWRISEKFLILSSFCMGALGALMAMVVFHHKISKSKFRILIPLAIITNIILVIVGIYCLPFVKNI